MAKETVLIADDDRVFVQFVTDVLRSHGFSVVAAFDATSALAMATRTAPVLAIVDINMPGGTGLGFLEKLRSLGRTAAIPAIAVSVNHDPAIEARLRPLGVPTYLQKPITPAALQAAVLEALDRTPPKE